VIIDALKKTLQGRKRWW